MPDEPAAPSGTAPATPAPAPQPAPAAPPTPPPAPQSPPPSPAAAAPSGTAPAAPEGTPGPTTPPSFDDWLKDPVNAGFVKSLRDEAASHRTGKKAAEDRAQGILAAVMQAAGLQPDGKPDPEKVIGELRAQNEATQAELRQLRVDAALGTALGKHQAQPALTRAVLVSDGTLKNLDPAAPDFAAALEAAVMKAVTDYPALRIASQEPATPPAPPAPPAPPVSGGQFQGPGASNGKPQLTREDLKGMKPEEVEAARHDGRLDALLGRL